MFTRTLVGLKDITDIQCGFKFFQRHAARDIFARQRIDGYMFDVEILYLARRGGLALDDSGWELQKALLRQWEELPLTESVNLSVGVFGKSFLTGEPQRLMQEFLDRRK